MIKIRTEDRYNGNARESPEGEDFGMDLTKYVYSENYDAIGKMGLENIIGFLLSLNTGLNADNPIELSLGDSSRNELVRTLKEYVDKIKENKGEWHYSLLSFLLASTFEKDEISKILNDRMSGNPMSLSAFNQAAYELGFTEKIFNKPEINN